VHLEDKAGGISGRWSQFGHAMRSVARRDRSPVATVIAGDFNTFDSRWSRLVTLDTDRTALGKPGSATEAAWWKTALLPRTGYVDAFDPKDWTFRVPCLFQAKLDWIAVKGGRVPGYGIGTRSLSDHRPIWTDVELDGAEAPTAGSAVALRGRAPGLANDPFHDGSLALE
jgi:endonuclease/exonuclease/phosphatase family metal-dependent hydrolase